MLAILLGLFNWPESYHKAWRRNLFKIASHWPFCEHILRRIFLVSDCAAGAQSRANQFVRLRSVVKDHFEPQFRQTFVPEGRQTASFSVSAGDRPVTGEFLN
jgi:hypothetical protein